MYLIFDNDSDPGMRFESLLRAIFEQCGKKEDPWGYAAQEVYNSFVHIPTLYGRRALSTGLCKLIYDYKDNESINKVIELEDRIWTSETQDEIIDIIDKTIDWIKINIR